MEPVKCMVASSLLLNQNCNHSNKQLKSLQASLILPLSSQQQALGNVSPYDQTSNQLSQSTSSTISISKIASSFQSGPMTVSSSDEYSTSLCALLLMSNNIKFTMKTCDSVFPWTDVMAKDNNRNMLQSKGICTHTTHQTSTSATPKKKKKSPEASNPKPKKNLQLFLFDNCSSCWYLLCAEHLHFTTPTSSSH
ncbi:hypothetical protein Droror1_Dr00027709 [Drosera rotundifolia]